jgi:hypothetical protein
MADTQVNASGGGSGGMYALLVVIIILILGAVLYFGGVIGTRGDNDADIDVRIETPEAPAPAK